MKFTTIALLLALAFVSQAAIQADLVTGLTEQTGYDKEWYSGYLDISDSKNTMKSHYWFFPSQNDPSSDPVLLWLNGGPGCSSLLGATQENGPFIFKVNSTEIELNENSWNMNASVIYIESPPGVGFSTSTKKNWSDEEVAQANLHTLLKFFEGFEEYRNLPFYISGESYAGIYIPTLARAILDNNKVVSSSQSIQLKGFIVGNGCTDPLECSFNSLVNPFMYEIFNAQGFFTPEQQKKYIKNCGDWNNPDLEKLKTNSCILTGQGQLQSVQPGLNIYNLIGTCYYQDLPNNSLEFRQDSWNINNSEAYFQFVKDNQEIAQEHDIDLQVIMERRRLQESNMAPACVDAIGPYTFFNTDSVKQALHVDTDIKWEMCSTLIAVLYSRSTTGSYYLYPDLISAGLRIWIYSGDVDAAVPLSGTLYWIEKLNKEQKYQEIQKWRAWYSSGAYQPENRQNAGQFWQTEGITLVTFKGCGHMVPQDNYVGGFEMINNFLQGKDMPKY